MTGTETCWNCQSEFPCEVGFVGKYKVVYGWCPECHQARLIWDNEAYEDDDFDVHTESDRIGKMLYDAHNRGFKINDTPEFQFIWTEKPTESHHCMSCNHCFKRIVDGEDVGLGCKANLEPKWDDEHRVNLCEEYSPRDTWHNMGGQCRYCIHNCQQICAMKGDLKDISDYDKGHCENYKESSIWGFERIGHTQCPQCGCTASIVRNGRVRCESCMTS